MSEKDYEFLRIVHSMGEAFFNVKHSKGGAVYLNGNNLLVFNSVFLDNKANEGSAIYIEENEQFAKFIFIQNSFFFA